MLLALHTDTDMTQPQIADCLNLKREVCRRYEKGIYELTVWALVRLSELYGMSSDYIMGIDTERRLPEKRA